jgi:transposase
MSQLYIHSNWFKWKNWNFLQTSSIYIKHANVSSFIAQRNNKRTKKNEMTWNESNEFMKKVNKIKKHKKRTFSFLDMWHTHVNENNYRTSLDPHNHFAN